LLKKSPKQILCGQKQSTCMALNPRAFKDACFLIFQQVVKPRTYLQLRQGFTPSCKAGAPGNPAGVVP
jgi:hypothetical protein